MYSSFFDLSHEPALEPAAGKLVVDHTLFL